MQAPRIDDAGFLDPGRFPFLQPLKENWRLFRSELDAFMTDQSVNHEENQVRTSGSRAMRSETRHWKVFPFIIHHHHPLDLHERYEVPSPKAIDRAEYDQRMGRHFSETRKWLWNYAAPEEHGVVNAFVSYFEPGARLGLHINYDPYMYRAHLGLLVPDGDVAFKVGDDVARWGEGDLLVFAPTTPHTAWNLTAHPRVVLIVDFFKPEADRAALREMEREHVKTMLTKNPLGFGMSGGMYDLDAETVRRFSVPRVEEGANAVD